MNTIFKQTRLKARITQTELATITQLNLNVIYEAENHIREGRLINLRKIANVLAVTSNFTANDLLIIHYSEMVHGITRKAKSS